MEIVVSIKIPKNFIGEWKKDRFKETFERVKADFDFWAGNYERETIDMLIEAFKNAEVTYVGSKEAASESSSRVSDCD
jgi:hypothetical protein